MSPGTGIKYFGM